jgi:hypothetical protein
VDADVRALLVLVTALDAGRTGRGCILGRLGELGGEHLILLVVDKLLVRRTQGTARRKVQASQGGRAMGERS